MGTMRRIAPLPDLRCLMVLALCCLTMAACGPRYESYGVLLWEREGIPYRNADLVPILRMFPRVETVEIELGEESKELPAHYFHIFSEEEEAVAYSETYEQWRWTYAYSEKSGLPVREQANQKSTAIYKLRKNQVIKVLSRAEEMSREGDLEDYWYEILTDDGFRGFCFGQVLKVYEAEGDPYAKALEYQSQDNLLDGIMNAVWRPEYFQDMIKDQRFDLERFRTDIGLFPVPSDNQVRISTDEKTFLFDYEKINKIGAATYVFAGTDLRMEVLGTNRLVASFKDEGKLVSHVFLLLQQNVGDVVREEQARRLDFYAGFAEKEFRSGAYGVITFDDDRNFRWVGFEKLVPAVLPREADGLGNLDFPYYLGKAIADEYHGVVTFHFREIEDGGRSFLYRITDSDLTLVFVRSGDIREMVIPNVGVSPLILFFEEIRS